MNAPTSRLMVTLVQAPSWPGSVPSPGASVMRGEEASSRRVPAGSPTTWRSRIVRGSPSTKIRALRSPRSCSTPSMSSSPYSTLAPIAPSRGANSSSRVTSTGVSAEAGRASASGIVGAGPDVERHPPERHRRLDPLAPLVERAGPPVVPVGVGRQVHPPRDRLSGVREDRRHQQIPPQHELIVHSPQPRGPRRTPAAAAGASAGPSGPSRGRSAAGTAAAGSARPRSSGRPLGPADRTRPDRAAPRRRSRPAG